MQVEFYKYQGTGNDFVMIDNRNETFPKNDIKTIAHLCDRRFGIGGDGLILLENDPEANFKMVYYNSDGNQSTMCGNGGRCLVAFAKKMNVIDNTATFNAIDGLHHASISPEGIVSLQMIDVDQINSTADYSFLNTGSPHHVQLVNDLKNYNVKDNGAALRYGTLYGQEGSNINFVSKIDNTTFSLRTYERGVEDETLACGTGATAVAIAMNATGQTTATAMTINVEGGKLAVSFDKQGNNYTNVFLIGPAEFVFGGTVTI
ncbi:diaminopimelate epimerase [Flavobacterium faecale]|uniref:Diaminopimelate epimerase n=1 Tax=Flavobacterium faecale TaxID=1355330 RepID=A0A2S1L8J1_9FLAO|nr:diaminopimelate epimerase [Flavobacterium faecale]AWG20024.1 diaminopimelate epimerase [Flavobacterium faecale]